MANMVTVQTEAPLTAESREAMIERLFADALPHYGELFVPNDEFYSHQAGPTTARHMLKHLCQWLGIKPGYIGLEFEAANQPVPDGRRYTIYVEADLLWDEFLLGAMLAYALTRYLLEDRAQIHLSSADQASLLATGSVLFGLGLVIMNGLATYGWFDRLLRWWTAKPTGIHEWSSLFKANYASLLRGFLKAKNIEPVAYSYSLTPWAAKKLQTAYQSQPTRAVRELKHAVSLTHFKLAGLVWLLVMIVVTVSVTLHNRVRPLPMRLQAAQEQADLLANLSRQCKDELGYQRQYADLTDIQTVRNLDATSLRCQSLDNQYEAAVKALTP